MAQLNSTNIIGNLAVTGKALASEFKKLGGTSAQFLKADGSVDIRDYIPITKFTEGSGGDGLTMEDLYNKITPQIGDGAWTFITISARENFVGLLSIKYVGGYYQIKAVDMISLRTLSTGGSASEIAVIDFITGGSTLPGSWTQMGTVTNITAGTGLSGGSITTSGTIALKNTGVHVVSGGNQEVYHCIATGFTNAAVNGNYIALELYSRAGESIKVMISSDGSACFGHAIRLSNTYTKIKAIGFSASDGKLYVTTDNFPNFLGCRVISCSEDVATPVMTTVTSRPSGLHEIAIQPVLTSNTLPLAASGTRGGIKIGYTGSGANLPVQLSSEKAYVALTKGAITSGLGYTPLPLTAGYGNELTGILYANKPIGIKGTFDNNVIPTDVQGVTYLAYNSSSKSLDFIFN